MEILGRPFSPQVLDIGWSQLAWERNPRVAVIHPTAPVWKRALDITCIVLALPALVPLMALIALYIKLVSRGPVLFQQERVGFRGQTFNCLKFRSMQTDAPTQAHQDYLKDLMQADKPMTKLDVKGDSRLIPMAWLIRSTGLDELPQLINVVRGDMSIVGPRPCTRYEYVQYLPWHRRRFNALPGLTGLWQVSGKNRTTFSEMIHLDVFYAENQSLRLDLSIMARTLPALINQVRDTRSAQAPSQPRLKTRVGMDGAPSLVSNS